MPAHQEQSTSSVSQASHGLFATLESLRATPLHTLAYKSRASGFKKQELAYYLSQFGKAPTESLPAELQQLQRDWREAKLQPPDDPLIWASAQSRFDELLRANGETEFDWAQIDGCPHRTKTQAGLRDMEAQFEKLRARPELHHALIAVFQEYVDSVNKNGASHSSSGS